MRSRDKVQPYRGVGCLRTADKIRLPFPRRKVDYRSKPRAEKRGRPEIHCIVCMEEEGREVRLHRWEMIEIEKLAA
jgi:hypothetical protein